MDTDPNAICHSRHPVTSDLELGHAPEQQQKKFLFESGQWARNKTRYILNRDQHEKRIPDDRVFVQIFALQQ